MMGIPLRGGKSLMPHKLLDRVRISPGLGEAGGKGVTKIVEPEAFDLGLLKSFLKGRPQSMEVYHLPARVRKDEILRFDRSYFCPRVFLCFQNVEGLRSQRNGAPIPCLPREDDDYLLKDVHVPPGKGENLSPPTPCLYSKDDDLF